ncbi:Uma2 family endonuclease [Streptomyces sp. ISL-11]|nr:Uma2 family endonuclease [Streptomyces sp. ISL-11]
MVETPPRTTPPPAISRTSEPTAFEEMCNLLEQIDADLPDGYRTEIIGGNIVVSPWSKGLYLRIMRSLVRQLRPHLPEGHEIDTSPCLFLFPGHERSYGPDIHVSDEALTNVDSIHLPGEALSLVGELTSPSTADFDRREKVEVYGRAEVPVYVLVDMDETTVTVYSSPSSKGYRTHTQIKFGEKVRIPVPFECELDTAGWDS